MSYFLPLWVPTCPLHVFYTTHCSTWLIHSCLGNTTVLTGTLPVQYDFYVQKCFGAVFHTDGTNWLTCIHLTNTEVVFPTCCPLQLFLPLGWDLIAAAGTTADLQTVIIFFSSVHHLLTFIWFPSGTHSSNKCYLLVQFCQNHKPGNKCCSWGSH